MKKHNWREEELLLAAELVFLNDWKPLDDLAPEVQELSRFLRYLGSTRNIDIDEKFRSPNSVALKTRNIASLHPTWMGAPSNGAKADEVALQRFVQDSASAQEECLDIWNLAVNAEVDENSQLLFDSAKEAFAIEGQARQTLINKRERDPRLRRLKIAEMRHRGGVQCEICGFSFEEKYGLRGADYIEIHHINPLHVSGEVLTSLDALIGLCANCHRMIHRGMWVTPDELRDMVSRQS